MIRPSHLGPRSVLIAVVLLLFALAAPSLAKKKDETKEEEPDSKLASSTFQGLALRNLGPALMSGRIADLAIDPRDRSTWYVAVGSGGVWKTVNAGTTWTPIFDDQGAYSIGDVTVDPSSPDTVWVGTGENVGGRHVAYGDGVYKSIDGGKSWKNMGLGESNHIGNIVVHPEDSNIVYVAAQGPLWSGGGDRGLFKTTDGGDTWTELLGEDVLINEYTGANEVHMDPRDPEVLYVATHQRFRNVAALINAGPGSGIYKSIDGGENWTQLTTGLPKKDKGKIGMAISPINPDVVYATIELENRTGGFWRSEDGGGSWEKRSDHLSGGTGPHYYQEIFADPHRFDRVYQMDPSIHFTRDGGKTFERLSEDHKHGDSHAMAFDPDDPDWLLVGSDGGLYQSWDLGANWSFFANLPVTQFYKVAVDTRKPFYNIYGGTQDNNTQGGPSQTLNVNGIRNSDWFITLFGDGHQPATDPSNPDIVYSEWQQGNLVRYDHSTGEMIYIQPQPAPGEPADRWNWDSPILVSTHDPATLYFASQRVWRSDDRGDSWRAISEDLTRGEDRLALPMMGRVWSYNSAWDLWAMSYYGTITSITQSPLDENLLYIGTDDGLIQVTEDGGQTWRRAGELPGVPDRGFVNDIKADLHDGDTVYVALDDHKSGDFRPFLLKSTDRGRTWTSIAGDPDDGGLPDRHLVWRVVQDHEEPSLLFAGTEFGIFFSPTGGDTWIELAGGVPQISFRDLAIHRGEDDLVGASFGRGFFVLDDYSPLRALASADDPEALLNEEARLFDVADALWYLQRRPLGRGEKATQGAGFFVAPNPPFGAVFTYHLAEGYETLEDKRRSEEKKIAKDGGDTPYPGWEALRAEDQEESPTVLLTVRDAEGNVVRHLKGPANAGFHRVAWDLRFPSTQAWSPRRGDRFFEPQGPLAAPGTYSVTLAKRVGGETSPLGDARSFEVRPLGEPAIPRQDPAATEAFIREVAGLERAVSGANAALRAANERVGAMKDVLERSTVADGSLRDEAVRVERELYALRDLLRGDRVKQGIGEPTAPSIGDRLGVISLGTSFSTYGPTPHHRDNYRWASEAFAEVRARLEKVIDVDLEALDRRLEASGVPWTPGRGVPNMP
ncbi:MAG: glycosyl hydrolase [Thermoanaerobaculia bacterium]|nr:glycosyl hydrolase [Thermoanaerobaculia bacterium]